MSNFFPTVTYFSVFGPRRNIFLNFSKYKIFFTGEDVTIRFPEYKDNCVKCCDLSLGFAPEEIVNAANYIRYPLWLLYYFGNHKELCDIQAEVDAFNKRWLDLASKKTKFCSLVASHDNYGTRKQLFELLNPYEPVKCAGRIFHNDDSLITDFGDDKVKYLEQFMFNLCPENVSAPGYTTEKLFQSFDSGCIPIYYGSEGIAEPEVVDNSKIIFFDGKNGAEVLSKVKELYENKEKYMEFMSTPPLKETAAQWIYDKNMQLQKKLAEIIKL